MKSITAKFTIHQVIYSTVCCGIFTYAATYLLVKGFSAANVGAVLFAANALSFILQPLLASRIDKIGGRYIPSIMGVMLLVAAACVAAYRFISISPLVFAALYAVAEALVDMQLALFNSLSVFYKENGFKINYGLGRGVSSGSYAIVSLIFGSIFKNYSLDWIPPILIAVLLIYALISFTYPKVKVVNTDTNENTDVNKNINTINLKMDDSNRDKTFDSTNATNEPLTLPKFFATYKWYTLSLLGIMALALVHIMVENFLIEILGSLGGDSSSLGIALFASNVLQAPVMCFFSKIHDKLGTQRMLLLSGLFYTLKAILLLLATSVTAVYFIQLLQLVTYVFLSPVQVNYSRECIKDTDMVKGQSIITASYTLGAAFGNLLGGILITNFSIQVMLICATFIAAAGFLILRLCVPRALKHSSMV